MKRIISILLALALSLGLVTVAQTPMPVMAASMFEHYNTGDDNYCTIYGSRWCAQTFTPSVAHTITSVKLMLYRGGTVGTPGIVTVSIRATSGGDPTGSDLCSGTTNGDTLTNISPGEWREITFTSSYSLSAGTQYAIVVRATSGDPTNSFIRWRQDGSSATYAGGTLAFSNDDGTNWDSSSYPNNDLMFEEWGDPLGGGGAVGWETYPISKARVLLPWIALVAAIMAGASLLVLRRRRAQS